MTKPKSKKKKKQPQKGGPLWALVRMLWSFVFGLGLTLFVLGILPYLQMVTGGGDKDLMVRDADAIAEAPPPPDSMEEEEPPPPDEPDEPPPEMQPQALDLSLSDLSDSMNPGGTGAGILNPAVGQDQMNNAMESFSSLDLDQKPRPVYQEAPRIPASARRTNLNGRIEVEFVVDLQGRVQNPRVVKSFNPLLNEPVIDAIKKWRFEPGSRGGKKVPFKTKMPFKFGS